MGSNLCKRWMVEFEIEAHIVLEKKEKLLVYTNPNKKFKVELRNGNVQPGVNTPTLNAAVIFLEEIELDTAGESATNHILEALEALSISTQSKWEVLHLRRIVDWTAGITERQVRQFDSFPDPNFPIYELNQAHIAAAEIVSASPKDPKLEKAIRWHHRAVNEKYPEIQFQMFWFALEILSERDKSTALVEDKCQKCRSPLHCNICNEISKHRPFAKQAIEQSIRQLAPADMPSDFLEKFIKVLFETRNCLLHGEFSEEIEKKVGKRLQSTIDHLGKIVHAKILKIVQQTFPPDSPIEFLVTDTYGYGRVKSAVDALVGVNGDPNNPEPHHISKFEVSLLEVE